MRLQYVLILLICFACGKDTRMHYQTIEGQTMGTYYRLTVGSDSGFPDKAQIDAQLDHLNMALSTYLDESVITKFNHGSTELTKDDIEDADLRGFFYDNVQIAYDLYEKTDGYFDPTVMPLVNYWGFGYQPRNQEYPIDTLEILTLLDQVGLDKLLWKPDDPWKLTKSRDGIELDFSASAKGYAIDQLALYLEEEFEINDYLVDIGGESRARGKNAQGQVWRIGINIPKAEAQVNEYGYILSLNNVSVATSGNYRNFYLRNGETISHTMNPKTGFYERNNLLSVSIVTEICAYADGFATACMAMGLEKAVKMIESQPSMEGMFIFVDENGRQNQYITAGLKEAVEISN